MEVSKDIILEWFKDAADLKKVTDETEKIYEEYAGRAVNFYKAFFQRL